MKRWTILAPALLAVCVACGGGGGGATAVVTPVAVAQAPTITSTSTAPAIADWVPGETMTLQWVLGGGGVGSEAISMDNQTWQPLWISGGINYSDSPITSYSFNPMVQGGTVYLAVNGMAEGLKANYAWTVPIPTLAPTHTALAMVIAGTGSYWGTLNATVSGSASGPTPTGSVIFYDSQFGYRGSAVLDAGVASLPIDGGVVGSPDTYTASYSGDSAYSGSSPTPLVYTTP